MSTSIHSKLLFPTKRSRGFTLIELLVVVAVLALLAATLLPALAANRRNPKMVQCLSNLRQIGMGCSVYASDFNGWYPIVSLGGFNFYPATVNHIGGIHYTRYVYSDAGPASGDVMPHGYAIGQGGNQGFDQNLGYLYGGGMISDGHAFFCPAFSGMPPSSPLYALSAEYYTSPQFMSTHLNESIRSSYIFNLRMKTATAGTQRAYQKVSDVRRLDVFAMDYLASNISGPGAPFTPDYWAHWPGQGLSTLFTDGSARFVTFAPANFNSIVATLNSDASQPFWAAQYNTVLNWLRDAP